MTSNRTFLWEPCQSGESVGYIFANEESKSELLMFDDISINIICQSLRSTMKSATNKNNKLISLGTWNELMNYDAK